MKTKLIQVLPAAFVLFLAFSTVSLAAGMNDYCITPPFISAPVPPLVMFETGRDHKLYYQAYNDAIDLDDDDKIDSSYKHSIQYYGYFDPYKCYTHSGGSTGGSGTTDLFAPVSTTTNKFCSSGQWSGNVLNWITMSRMDVLKKVLYGGQRDQESPATILQRVFVPQDAHSWGKELTGRLCYNTGNALYTTTCITSSDCQSGDICVDKSNELIGINAADAPSECSSPVTVNWNTSGRIFVAKYQALDQSNNVRTGICGDYTYSYDSATNQSTERDDIYLSYFNWNTTTDAPLNTPLNLKDRFYITNFDYQDPAATNKKDLNPLVDHMDNFNFFAVTEFEVTNSTKGDWQFLLDGDDGVELLIDGVVQSIYPGCHGACFPGASSSTYPPKSIASYVVGVCPVATELPPIPVTVNLTQGWHRLIVRHRDRTVNDGARVWYRATTSDSTRWTIFGDSLTLRAPTIDAGNACSILSPHFIGNGTPVSGTAKRHIFCNTTLAANDPPIMRLSKNSPNRMWDWAARERPVCGTNMRVNGNDYNANAIDYTVRVEVCKTGLMESNCQGYPIGSASPSSYKPVGLFQKFGEGDGTKICSRTMSKSCNTDSNCDLATEGLCIDKAAMYFGMMSTTYAKNKSGGVLRKNFGSVLDEVEPNNGQSKTAENISGNIIHTFDRLKVIDFDFTGSNTPSYLANCPFSAGAYGIFTEGSQCRMWGNPIAEMMYESLRYLAGKGTSTAEFDYSGSQDAGLSLSHPPWGKFREGSATYKPYSIFPSCSKPFLLVLSDINTSYDSDQLPGTSFGSYSEDLLTPALNLNVTTLADKIGAAEGIDGNSYFIGETSTLKDYVCSAKTVSKLSLIRGICPEEPTKLGSFYAAAVAHYGKTAFHTNTGLPEVNTFAVALSSPVADLKIKAGDSYITVVPVGKSVHGGWTSNIHCLDRCPSSYIDSNKGLVLSGCDSAAITLSGSDGVGGAYCPSNQIVNVFVNKVAYDTNQNVIYAKFSINFEDVEMGSDHDMDAIVEYEICTLASKNMTGTSCNADLSSDQVEIKLNSAFSAGGVDQAIGFVVSGTQSDGLYLPVRDTDSSSLKNGVKACTSCNTITLPTSYSGTFTKSSTSTASGFLHNPLWYAAKWGGYNGTYSGSGDLPRSTWAKNCTETDITKCDPDNYFLVTNPLKLEHQLDTALNDILKRVSSGTASSILNNSEGSGANLLQAVFYPKKDFDNETEAIWIGEMQNLWYYLDPFLQKTSIREDTANSFAASAQELNLNLDRIAKYYFDTGESKTRVQLFSDLNGDGSPDSATPDTTLDPDYVASLWRAGQLLHARDLSSSPRTIYTYTTGTGFTPFDTVTANIAKIKPYLDVSNNDANATAVINYVTGYDDLDDTTLRSRTVSYKGVGGAITNATVRSNAKTKGIGVWKLGDIISSTPKILANVRLNSYYLAPPLGYNDTSYKEFLNTSTYKNRGMAFVGANDGMLHAFKMGTLEEVNNKFIKATLNGSDLGKEMWSFIPKNALPYLKYLSSANPEYCHLYFVDNSTVLTDVSINKSTSCAASSNYWECDRKYGTSELSWRTILIGGMGLGGASKNTVDAQCVKTPIQVTEGGTAKDIGYSSYFALDVTDPASPAFKWEFSGDPANGDYLGYTTTGPAIVRVGDRSKNGRWFAVFASGPTGPIDTTFMEFKGTSNQPLKLFIVDIATGSLVKKITTTITNAFAGSLASGVIDTDRWDASSTGFYNDDAVYIGYVQKDSSTGTWTKGGVIRLLTKESTDPGTWTLSTVIEDTGPVTTAITKLQDRKNKNLWLFFGTGRYFFKMDDGSTTTRERLYGIKEPCYSINTGSPLFTPVGPVNDIDKTCSSTVTSGLVDQTTSPKATLSAANNGWYIELDAASGGFLSERIITDPLAAPSGAVFFTSFKPTGDICKYGGNSYIWSVRYDTGAEPPAAALKGVALMQVSTGSFAEIKLSDAFTDKDKRRIGTPITGVPPKSQGLSLLAPPRPTKKMLQIQEK